MTAAMHPAEVLAEAHRVLASGRFAAAAALFRRFVALSPGEPAGFLGLGHIAVRSDALGGAIPMFARAAALAPGLGRVVLDLGRLCAHDGRADRAATALRAALALDPGSAEGWIALAMLIHAAQGPVASVAAFRRVARLLPEAASAHLNLGNVLFDSGSWAKSGTSLRQVLALEPARAYALFQLGRVARRTGLADVACHLLDRAARLEPATSPAAADIMAELTLALRDCGRWQDAVRHGWRAAVLAPDRYDAHLVLGTAAEAEGCTARALAAYERAIHCHPGFGEAFTRRAVLRLRQSWKAPSPRSPAGRAGRRLAATELGCNGRFGNQLLQYGFLRLYAARHDLDLEVPEWVGRYLYDCDDPLPGTPLPRLSEEDHDFFASLSGTAPVRAECDVTGYFCRHTGALAPYRQDFRRIFTPGRYLWPRAEAIEHRLRARGRTVVALHLRRGDYGWGRFWIAPELWYRTWLERLWSDLDSPVLYLATDAPELAAAFAPFSPVLAADLCKPLAGAEFFTDFHALCVADVLAISNSTFSFVSGLLNRTARRFVRPDRHRGMLVPYDPWNAEVLL
nr:tetratricopeptide repeat protein [Azospirillum sp. 412522]